MTATVYFKIAVRDKRLSVSKESGESQVVYRARQEERFARQNNKDRCERMNAKKGGKITIRKFSFDG